MLVSGRVSWKCLRLARCFSLHQRLHSLKLMACHMILKIGHPERRKFIFPSHQFPGATLLVLGMVIGKGQELCFVWPPTYYRGRPWATEVCSSENLLQIESSVWDVCHSGLLICGIATQPRIREFLPTIYHVHVRLENSEKAAGYTSHFIP